MPAIFIILTSPAVLVGGWEDGLGGVLGLVCLGEVGGFSLCVAFLLHVKKKIFVQHFVLHFFSGKVFIKFDSI